VRLASRLTGWKTDIKSETEVEKTSRKVIDDLTTNLQVNEILARILFDEYLRDVRDIIRLTPEELNKITSISIEDCARIIENAKVIAANLDSAQAAKLESTEAAEPEPAQAANLESTEAAEPEPAQKGEEGEAAEGIALP
jgi:hypothetical protein